MAATAALIFSCTIVEFCRLSVVLCSELIFDDSWKTFFKLSDARIVPCCFPNPLPAFFTVLDWLLQQPAWKWNEKAKHCAVFIKAILSLASGDLLWEVFGPQRPGSLLWCIHSERKDIHTLTAEANNFPKKHQVDPTKWNWVCK